jgi:hypothetical protein
MFGWMCIAALSFYLINYQAKWIESLAFSPKSENYNAPTRFVNLGNQTFIVK